MQTPALAPTVALALALAAGAAQAPRGALAAVAPAAVADWMPGGTAAPPPAGYLDWCRRNPETCGVTGLPGEPAKVEVTRRYWSAVFAARPAGAKSPVAFAAAAPPAAVLPWTDDTRRLLDRVNRHVNASILEQDDRVTYGVEDYWAIPTLVGKDRYGDCEDYVLMKRRDLIAAGVPAETLFIAVVETRDRKPHAVLLAATDSGEMVLDSLTPWIKTWREAPYLWIERQAPGDAFAWVRPAVKPFG